MALAACDSGAPPPTPAISDEPAPTWDGEFESAGGQWRLRYRADPRPIPRNAMFELDAEIVPADANVRITAVDAFMPDHRHGMTLRPHLRALGGGRYHVDGMLFHMSGLWELLFTVRHVSVEHGTDTERVRFEVVLE